MIELLSATLAKLGAIILAGAAKKTIAAIKDLVSDDEAKAIVNGAFMEFRGNVLAEGKGAKDEKALLEVFELFFTDDRVMGEFQLVFDAQSEKVDFDLLEEIFARICIDKEIEIPSFDFRRAISYVIKEIERLAREQDKFKGLFQTAHLEKIYKSLQTRGKEPNLSYARFKYLDQLQRHHNQLFFAGIPDLKEKKEIQLPAIFVMPRARESVEVDEYRQLMREKQGDDEFTGEEIHLQRMLVKRETEKPPIKFDTVFNESANRRFVVLGKPGSGKSTLLKFLVLEAARLHLENHRAAESLLFPILVEIRKFENAWSKTNRTNYNILDFLYDSMRTYYTLDLPDGFFEKYLLSGRALLLFDGLDEVAAESRRAEIRQMIASFVSGYSAGNTVIVTSRIAGYSRAQFSTTDYRHFTLEDFNDEEINAFLKNWYRGRLANEKEAEIKANDLKDALEKKPHIKELARNPLLLTIIGFIHRDEEQLPEDRLLLYDKATETLLNTWDNVKEIIDERFKLAHRKRFLCQVAFQLQSQEKGDEAGTMIHRNDLYNILLGDFCKVFNCDNWEAQELVNDFLEIIHSRTGLLVEVGTDWFGFAHKTFQEYFAAKWIVNEQRFNKNNFQIMIDYVDKYIDNAFWQETLLLALQALPDTQALNVLKHILRRDPRKIEPYFYHNHYFVMKFIAEKGEWLNDKEFVESQISDFFRFSWNEGKERSPYPNLTWERFTNWVSTVTDSLAGSILLEKLLALAEDEKQDGRFRHDCAETVGYLGMKDNAVVERLLVLAEDEKQGVDFRRSCAYAVGILGSKDISVLERLVHLVKDESQDGDLRRFCVCVLGELDMKDKVVEILLQLAEDEKQNGDLRRECALALGNLSSNNKSVAERLLHMVENENLDCDSRSAFAYVVGKSMLKDRTMEERLIRIAEDGNQEGYLRRSCAYALGELGVKDKALEILLHLAEDENQAGGLRFSCAHSVGDLGLKEKTIEILLQLAEDENQTGFLRQDCAKAIGKLGMEDKAVEILLQLIEDEKQTSNLRDSCAYNVGESRVKDKNLVERLLHLVEDTKKDGDFRVCLVEAVGNSRLKDKVLAERLLHLAEDENRDGNLRRYCAYTVGHLGCKDKAVEILLHIAQDEKQDGILRSSCASTVGDLGEKDKAVEILIDLYLAEIDKYSNNAKWIYNFLWKLTAV